MLKQVITVSGFAFITVHCDITIKPSDTRERKLELQEKLIQKKTESVTSSLLFLSPFLSCVFFTNHLKHKIVNKTTCRMPSANLCQL